MKVEAVGSCEKIALETTVFAAMFASPRSHRRLFVLLGFAGDNFAVTSHPLRELAGG